VGLGYQSEWARAHFPARRERNAFFTQAGRLAVPGTRMAQLKSLTPDLSPVALLERLAPPA